MFITTFKRNQLLKATKTYIMSKGISSYSSLTISELKIRFSFIKKEYITSVIFPIVKSLVSDEVAFDIFSTVINSSNNIPADEDVLETIEIEKEFVTVGEDDGRD